MAILFTVADSKNSVVNVGTATGGKNTTLVVVESTAIGINGNSDGLLGNSRLKLRWAVVGDIAEALDTNLTSGAAVLARAIATSVFVVRLELDVVALGVFEGSLLKTTVATSIIFVAVNELLLREGKKLASSDLVSTFHGTSRGERPAGTA